MTSDTLRAVADVAMSWLGRGVAHGKEGQVGTGRGLLELHRQTGNGQFLDAAREHGGRRITELCILPV
jgi:hypothetical protein